ncbi:MAG: hypothetical protein JXL84_09245 [Deltaproteobacteria bacterium]|nr:hypothetical protein [Deltaproteobacteria bacterium]
MNIIEAIHDERLFRSAFKDLFTWSAWFVLLKAMFGIPFNDDAGRDLFRACTGRASMPERPFRELWAVVGRRGGKSFMAGLVAVYLALFHDYREHLSPGERGTIQIVASDRAQAQTILGYCKGLLHTNRTFEECVETELTESITLNNRIVIEVMPASYRSIRGRTVVAALFDEIAFWRSEGVSPDREILAAVRPSMATIPESKLIVISSPYARTGVLYEHMRDYFGKDDPDILIWRSGTRVMNPTIPESFIDRETAKDPNAARAEWEAEFREDIEEFLTLEALNKCLVLPGPLAYEPGRVYSAFVDPSGGRSDAFTLAVGYRRPDDLRFVVSLLKAWEAPFSPEGVVSEIAEILRGYRVTRITGDRYSAEWVTGAFSRHSLLYDPCEKAKSDLYVEFEAHVNVGRVELPKDEAMKNELMTLERRRGKSGRDIVDHPPRAHDDRANAVAGLVFILNRASGSFFSECLFTSNLERAKAYGA